jgi:hypothetical protein
MVPGSFITVFSTACLPFHDWQSEALVFSHYKHQVRGSLIRIDACATPNYTYPQIWHPHYSIFRTPTFEHQQNSFGPDTYSGYNRPGGLVYWLEHDKLAASAEFVIVLDPDMILRSSLDVNLMGDPINYDFAGPGRVGGGVYDFGNAWYNDFAKAEFKKMGCPFRSCELTDNELSLLMIGPPLLFTYPDLLLLASPWMEFTKTYRAFDKNKGWAQEMYGLTMALVFHGNRPNVSSFLFVSAPGCAKEGWDCVDLPEIGEKDALFKYHPQHLQKVSPILHYCQSYKIRPDVSFYKYQFTHGNAEALLACSNPPTRLPILDFEKELQLPLTSRENVDMRRNTFMFDEVTKDANGALDHYRKVAC